MRGSDWVLIFMNIFAALAIVFIVLIGLSYQRSLTICETNPSELCYNIHCPCSEDSQGPCFGFAKRSVGENRWVCINSPLTVVDNQGKKV